MNTIYDRPSNLARSPNQSNKYPGILNRRIRLSPTQVKILKSGAIGLAVLGGAAMYRYLSAKQPPQEGIQNRNSANQGALVLLPQQFLKGEPQRTIHREIIDLRPLLLRKREPLAHENQSDYEWAPTHAPRRELTRPALSERLLSIVEHPVTWICSALITYFLARLVKFQGNGIIPMHPIDGFRGGGIGGENNQIDGAGSLLATWIMQKPQFLSESRCRSLNERSESLIACMQTSCLRPIANQSVNNMVDLLQQSTDAQSEIHRELGHAAHLSLDSIFWWNDLTSRLEENQRTVLNHARTFHPLASIPQPSRVSPRKRISDIEVDRKALEKMYIRSIREIASDGNCFYTSFTTILLEAVAERRFQVTDDWIQGRFTIPDYSNPDLFTRVRDLLINLQDHPDRLEEILNDSNQILPFVKYLRDLAAHAIQRQWVLNSLIETPHLWLTQNEISLENMGRLSKLKETLAEFNEIRESAVAAFRDYAPHVQNARASDDLILALFLCILERESIRPILKQYSIDPEEFSIRHMENAAFRKLDEQFYALGQTDLTPDQRIAYDACLRALQAIKANRNRLRQLASDNFVNDIMNQYHRHAGAYNLVVDQIDSWRASLAGDFQNEHLMTEDAGRLLDQYVRHMGQDAMQQTIEALSHRLDFPFEINIAGAAPMPTTIDGREPFGSLVRNGTHYFVGYEY